MQPRIRQGDPKVAILKWNGRLHSLKWEAAWNGITGRFGLENAIG